MPQPTDPPHTCCGEPRGSQPCWATWYFEVMFIISPSSFKELCAMTSSFQIIVYTITTCLSELYTFSSQKFSRTQLQNWKNWKIKLKKFRNSTVLVLSPCSKSITHRLVVCVSHTVVNQSKETNERVDECTKPYDTIFQVLTWHESMNEWTSTQSQKEGCKSLPNSIEHRSWTFSSLSHFLFPSFTSQTLLFSEVLLSNSF